MIKRKTDQYALIGGLAFMALLISTLGNPLQVEAGDTNRNTITISVDGDQLLGVRRFSYRVSMVQKLGPRPGVGNPLPDDEDYAEVIRGKISVYGKSAMLKELMAEQLFVDLQVVQRPESDRTQRKAAVRKILFQDCRIVGREVQLTRSGKKITIFSFVAERLYEK